MVKHADSQYGGCQFDSSVCRNKIAIGEEGNGRPSCVMAYSRRRRFMVASSVSIHLCYVPSLPTPSHLVHLLSSSSSPEARFSVFLLHFHKNLEALSLISAKLEIEYATRHHSYKFGTTARFLSLGGSSPSPPRTFLSEIERKGKNTAR